ncbi:MAG: tetratricopeptide repeat protein, partial [Alteraurantiacibacter sp.]
MIHSLSSSPARFLALVAVSPVALVVPSLSVTAETQEVVQALPDPSAEELNDALRRLSRNPQSVPALVAAGRASLSLDDVDAALGFFSRAQDVAPEDTRVLVGLALVALRRGEAVTALQLFENAEAGGVQMMPYEAEKGLAYDLVGRNQSAQRLYRRSLAREDDPTIRRRLALSYAISGNAEESENALMPLLQRQDRAAFRTRAFALAIMGNEQEAISIAETMLPQRISMRLAPFLRYMPRLTPAQQAAAVNQGRFPAAREIGTDSNQIAGYTAVD